MNTLYLLYCYIIYIYTHPCIHAYIYILTCKHTCIHICKTVICFEIPHTQITCNQSVESQQKSNNWFPQNTRKTLQQFSREFQISQ